MTRYAPRCWRPVVAAQKRAGNSVRQLVGANSQSAHRHGRVITAAASPEIAARFTDAIVNFCFSLAVFPERGTRRDDLRPGLRITNYRKRTVIAFTVDTRAQQISILGIFHGGQDHEAAWESENPPE